MKLTDITKNLAKDGKRVEAFFKDWAQDLMHKTQALPSLPDKGPIVIMEEQILQIPYLLIATALKGAKAFSLWRPSSWDVLRPMRDLAKDIATERNYQRYLELI